MQHRQAPYKEPFQMGGFGNYCFAFELENVTWVCSAPATCPGISYEGLVLLVVL